jgi:hypothetical protein
MSSNQTKKKPYMAVLASVKEEMAEPRVAASAKIEAEKQSRATVKEAAKT